MITPGDEFPFHQTSEPIAFAGTDRNFYDRYFFNGYSSDGSIFFAVAFGIYPQLDIMDAAVCVIVNGVQHNLRASRWMHGNRADLTVGPIRIVIVEPLQSLSIIVADNESGMSAALTFIARHHPVEEPRFTRRVGTRAFMDYTRLTQNVTWGGHLIVDGERIELEHSTTWGTRDRSWGVRPVGLPDPQPPYNSPVASQFFWLWTPANFRDHMVFCHTNDDGEGLPWNRKAVIEHAGGRVRHFDNVEFDIGWSRGTRRIERLVCHMDGRDGSASLSFTPQSNFYMSGLGYSHPEWGHGRDHGELRVAYDTTELATVDNSARLYLHIQALAKAELELDGQTFNGFGVVEQLFIGPNALRGLPDGIAPANALVGTEK